MFRKDWEPSSEMVLIGQLVVHFLHLSDFLHHSDFLCHSECKHHQVTCITKPNPIWQLFLMTQLDPAGSLG